MGPQPADDAELRVVRVIDGVVEPEGLLGEAVDQRFDAVDLLRLEVVVGHHLGRQRIQRLAQDPAVLVRLEGRLGGEPALTAETVGDAAGIPACRADEPREAEIPFVEDLQVTAMPELGHVRSDQRGVRQATGQPGT